MAITQDSNTQLSQSGAVGITNYTLSHTCTGADLLLVAHVFDRSGDNITAVTYNGVSMTLIGKIARNNDPSGQGMLYMYYLLNPSTGTNNIVASRSASQNNYIILGCTSYTGVRQSSQPNVSTTNQNPSVNSLTTSVTTTDDNTFAYLVTMWDASGGSATAGTGSSLLGTSLSNWASFESSSLALSPAGSKSMTYNVGGSAGILTAVMAAFSPAVATPTSGRNGRYLSLLGVGN